MEILPAIDLFEGRCVRLIQGRYDRLIDYECDPADVAQRFRDAGAHWVHVVDLEAARSGHPANLEALRRIVASGLHVEFGGGMRDEASLRAALEAGADRVIVGTRALEDWSWFRDVAARPEFSRRISLGLDARLGLLMVRGWTQATRRTAAEVAEAVHDWPLAEIVYTDVTRDGMLLGPNIEAIHNLVRLAALPVVAAGGVTDLDDVRRLAAIGLRGVVIGRAIYEGTITLGDAIEAARSAAPS